MGKNSFWDYQVENFKNDYVRLIANKKNEKVYLPKLNSYLVKNTQYYDKDIDFLNDDISDHINWESMEIEKSLTEINNNLNDTAKDFKNTFKKWNEIINKNKANVDKGTFKEIKDYINNEIKNTTLIELNVGHNENDHLISQIIYPTSPPLESWNKESISCSVNFTDAIEWSFEKLKVSYEQQKEFMNTFIKEFTNLNNKIDKSVKKSVVPKLKVNEFFNKIQKVKTQTNLGIELYDKVIYSPKITKK